MYATCHRAGLLLVCFGQDAFILSEKGLADTDPL
jgi:hypothetical protein